MGQASSGKQTLTKAFVFLGGGLVAAFVLGDAGTALQAFLILYPLAFVTTRLLYYSTARLAFGLIHRNYKFFSMFFTEPELGIIWYEPWPHAPESSS